ncbi:unnamed protein product, partial [Phaedon cochleariae]
EGQRKALFEEYEAERKSNAEQILKLKKEISQLIVVVHENTNPTAKFRIKNRKLESIIGPLNEKSCNEVQELLDLQIINKKKKLDLLEYKIKQRKKYLEDLGAQYQKMLSKHDKKELDKKVEQPVKKTVCELQNKIHSVDVQIREAMHIKNRYTNIKQSLKEDANKFESNIRMLEEELHKQKADIQKLQKIMNEATRMRSIARANLLREEKEVNKIMAEREREAAEGRKLVNERKIELERLERKLFQGGRIPARLEPQGAEDTAADEKSLTPPHPVESMAQKFEILKKATGGTSADDILDKFKSQRETQEKLAFLRTKAESEKIKLEAKLESLKIKLDSFKYAEVQDAGRKTGDVENFRKDIESKINTEDTEKKQEDMKYVEEKLLTLNLCVNPLAMPDGDGVTTLRRINEDMKEIIGKHYVGQTIEQVQNIDMNEDKWLPALYTGLIRRTPLPQSESSPIPPAPPGSDDEEDVPSRGYLKRQAQLVVDAKSRKKNIRIQLPRRT